MNGIAFDIVDRFRKKQFIAPPVHLNDLKVELHSRTRFHLVEARRAIANAYKHLILNERNQFAEWMDSAIFLLLEAEQFRMEALEQPWRR